MKRIILCLAWAMGLARAIQAQGVITGDTSVCAGEVSLYLFPASPNAANWTVSGGNILGPASGDTLTVSWPNAGPGTVSIAVTQPNNTVIVHTLNVIVNPLPVPVISHLPYPGCPVAGADPAQGSGHGQGEDPPCEKVCELATITYSTPFNAGSTYQW
ncbi:MAG: hypothetical protein IH599_04045, partial [Bacteroidales bacterium]|nr:hypothetical protein [Bacteroidales bacterium]